MDTRAHVERYAQAIDAAQDFQPWFNRASSEQEATANGFWDFAIHVVTPEVRFNLVRPEIKTALEIGCGGGRLLNAASRFFGSVIGVDIHNRMGEVDKYLRDRGVKNATVLRGDGETLPIESASVDFVYSFIVFHHLQSLEAFRGYLRESYRCLKPGGLAHLYYGLSDRIVERLTYSANEISLAMPSEVAARSASDAGFVLLSEGMSWRFGEQSLRRGYQASMLLVKR